MLLCAALLGAYAWPTGALAKLVAAPPLAFVLLVGSTLCSMVVGDSLYFLAAARIGVARALPIASASQLARAAVRASNRGVRRRDHDLRADPSRRG